MRELKTVTSANLEYEAALARVGLWCQKQKTEKCILIHVAIPSDSNVIKKKAKCKDLHVEIQQMCKMKCVITPVII